VLEKREVVLLKCLVERENLGMARRHAPTLDGPLSKRNVKQAFHALAATNSPCS